VLGLAPVDHGLDAHIVITDVGGVTRGLIVDAVHDVRAVADTAIAPPGPNVPLQQFISGVAKLQDRLLMILDIERLLSADEDTAGQARKWERAPVRPDQEATCTRREELHRRAQKLSRVVEEAEAQRGETATLVCFTLGKGAYALRVKHAKEIVPSPRVTPVPCAPEYVLGVVNIRGMIMPVVSLARFLDFQQDTEALSSENRVIVSEADGMVVALSVDKVLGISEVNVADIQASLSLVEREAAGFVEGEFDNEGRTVCVMDLPAILRALERQQGEETAASQ
jgi:purine-binding chemotaxis protein CheW